MRVRAAFLSGLMLLALAVASPAAEDTSPAAKDPNWSAATLELAASLPIQEGGRVKPLSTFARYQLMAVSGGSSFKWKDESKGADAPEVKITAVMWVLDCLFRPELATKYRIFTIQTSEVLDAIGVSTEGRKKRDRYSFEELAAAGQALMKLAQQVSEKEGRDRTVVQEQVLALANNLIAVDHLLSGLARSTPHGGGGSDVFAVFPPPGTPAERPDWLTPEEVRAEATESPGPMKAQKALLDGLNALTLLAGDAAKFDPAKFEAGFRAFHDGIRGLAEARDEYRKIPLEVFLFKWSFFHWSLGFFVLGFLAVLMTWLLPKVRVLRFPAPAFLVAGLLALTFGIALRCVIRGRPPVTTLYETILFITATAVLSALVIETFSRKGIAIALGAVLGFGGMFLADRYEVSKGEDTMPQLVAVLDTNFWLATHVTTISLGYAAGLLAAAIGHVYVFGKLFGLGKEDPHFYKTVTRMVYGVTCFALLFSIIGTLLGGIWANDSWGRFWGWDPKENGALMICLWTVAVIHACIGGYVRDLGLSLCAVFGAIVVAFSWWGVNLLGVGLHSYGFTSGVLRVLVLFCAFEMLVVLAGIPIWLMSRGRSTVE